MQTHRWFAVLVTGCCMLANSAIHLAHPVAAATRWNPTAAAEHMDQRQMWWMNWPKARRDHDTACVSCHTALPYAMARASLRQGMDQPEETDAEQTMLAYVTKRVNGWTDMEPFYGEKSGPRKSVESRVTESVLNALVLARYDSLTGTISPVTHKAFDNMWATQLTGGDAAGAWEWLNFHNAPWEGETSSYFGATLAALAVGYTPASYSHSAEALPHIVALRQYLQRKYEAQPLLNKALLLWSSSRFPGVFTKEQRTALVREIEQHQSPDGGWSLASMGVWKRRDNTPIDTASDGYATGLSILALRSAGVHMKNKCLLQGVTWLENNQDSKTGMWMASSLNKKRPPESDPYLFMSDSATGFAVMALEAGR